MAYVLRLRLYTARLPDPDPQKFQDARQNQSSHASGDKQERYLHFCRRSVALLPFSVRVLSRTVS
jgi:hypothetical protein